MHLSEKCAFGLMVLVAVVLRVTSGEPWEPPAPPECQSYNNLCDINYDVIDTNSSGGDSNLSLNGAPMCQCPGNNTCPRHQNDTDRVLLLEMMPPGQTLKISLSYCYPLKRNKRPCRMGELAVTLRGVGPVVLGLVGGVRCTCDERLTLKKVRPDGMYAVQYYACGKRECRVNDSSRPICQRIKRKPGKFANDVAVATKYPCACPAGYECSVENSQQSSTSGDVTDFTCWPKQQP